MRVGAVLGGTAMAAMVVLVSAVPAEAKGLSGGVIDGEGLGSPIVIAGGNGGQYPAPQLWEDLGLYPAVFSYPGAEGQAPSPLLDEAPTTDLGPELTITWTVPGPDGERAITQELYLYAGGGPLLHTAPGQPVLDDETLGGWFRASPDLVENLQALGVPERSVLAAPTPASPSAPVDASADGSTPWVLPAGTVLVAVLLLGSGAVLVARRRRISPAVT